MRSIQVMCGITLMGMMPAASWGQGYAVSLVAGGGFNEANGVPATQDGVTPGGVAVDAAGNFYFTGLASFVGKVTPNGIITIIAGSLQATTGFSGDGGPATNAQFDFDDIGGPSGIAVDSSGNVYVADVFNNCVRKIDTNGIITTVAGGGSSLTTMYGDGGPATAAYLPLPRGVAVDNTGNLYIADGLLVRKVAPNGTITAVAGCLPNVLSTCDLTGSIGDGGPATSAYLGAAGVAVDSSGNLYIADSSNNRIRKVSTSGIITTVAGSASGSYQGDGGPATSAGLNNPTGVAVDAAGNIYIDDRGDYRIRMVTPDGTITTIAGNGAQAQYGGTFEPAYPSNGVAATSISLGLTLGVAVGPGGKIYVADVSNGVWLLTPNPPSGGAPPSVSGVISASAFGAFTAVAPGSFIEIYGQNLAADARGWSGADFNGINAPTSLDQTSVTVGGQPAYVSYISPGQVNVQVPSNIGTGSQPLVVNTSAGSSNTATVTVNGTEPGLLAPSTFNIGGTQYVAAFFPDGSVALPPGAIAGVNSRRAQPGDTLTLYGIGFGSVIPNIPAGQIPQQNNILNATFQVNFGSTAALITYDGLAPGLVGVYQFNVVVPSIGAGDSVPLTFILNGVQGTQTLYISVQD